MSLHAQLAAEAVPQAVGEPMTAAALTVALITAIVVVWLAGWKPRSGWDRPPK